VYDRAEGRWLQVYRHEGRAYIVGKPGHEYQADAVAVPELRSRPQRVNSR
jgi:hypothetical protein